MRIGCACNPPAVLVAAMMLSLCAAGERRCHASSVAPMPLTTMSEHTAQAFIGEVVSMTSHWAENPRRIETDITFANVQYLKGQPEGGAATRILTVPGGEVDGIQARLCCSPRIEVGQKWVLLILPEYRVYPVVGLHQGAFKVQRDKAGVERVYHASSRAITGIDKEGFALVENTRFDLETQRRLHESHSADHNVRIDVAGSAEKSTFEAMPLQEFLSQLQATLDASKSYRNAEQAGRRVAGGFKAVPLRKANAEARAEPAKAQGERTLRATNTVRRTETQRPAEPQAGQKEAK